MVGQSNDLAKLQGLTQEERQSYEQQARSAALTLSGTAISKGATTNLHDGKLSPCGLRDVLGALVGEETYLLQKEKSSEL